MLVVYISNKSIKVVKGVYGGGKINIQGLCQMEDNGGSILNGTIVDREALKSMLFEMWNANKLPKKEVYLMLTSNQITMRMLDMPALKEKEMLEYITRELSGVDRITNPVYGYFVVEKKGKMQKVFATAAPKDYLQQFVDIFKEIGVELNDIENVKAPMIRLVSQIPKLQDKTAAIQFIDYMNLTNVLFVNGKYQTFNEKRLFSDPGTPGFSVEAARAISELMQFAKTQSIENPISNIYVAGISEEDYPIYEDSVGRINPDLKVEVLKAVNVHAMGSEMPGRDFGQYALAIGGLIQPKGKVDLLNQMKASSKAGKQKKGLINLVVPCLGGCLVIAILFTLMISQRLSLNAQLKSLEDYISSPDTIAKCEEYDRLSGESGKIARQIGSVKAFRTVFEEYPKVDRKLLEEMQKQAGSNVSMEITGFNSDNGSLNFTCAAAQVEDINRFVDSLEKTKILTNLKYGGYEYVENTEMWNVTIMGVVAPEETENTAE